MIYELWDLTTRNVAGHFDDEAAALAAIREAFGRHGRDYAEAFALVREDRRGRSTTIARGGELVERAIAAESRTERVSA